MPIQLGCHLSLEKSSRGHQLRYVDATPESNEVTDSTLLCVHGNPTWSYYFQPVIERFSKEHRVIAVDHLGCGKSDKPPAVKDRYTLRSHANRLIDIIETLDLQNVTLVAHDWGGAIGTLAAVDRPDRFRSLVLLNTATFPPPFIPLRIAACRWPLVGPLAVRGLNAFARAAIFMAMDRKRMPKDVAAKLLEPYDSWKNRVAIHNFVQDIPMKPSHPTYAVLADLESRLPTLSDRPIDLVWGMKDWCFRPSCLEQLESVWPHARSTRIDDAGHYVMLDATEEVLSAIDAHLQSV